MSKKYYLDQGAFVEYLKESIKCHLHNEEEFAGRGFYELASCEREQRIAEGNILYSITGCDAAEPNEAFMKPLTNVRAAVNAMSDEELADVLPAFLLINKEGSLVECSKTRCNECPAYTGEGSCQEQIREYMLQEVEVPEEEQEDQE